jgi:hypothetical protein
LSALQIHVVRVSTTLERRDKKEYADGKLRLDRSNSEMENRAYNYETHST